MPVFTRSGLRVENVSEDEIARLEADLRSQGASRAEIRTAKDEFLNDRLKSQEDDPDGVLDKYGVDAGGIRPVTDGGVAAPVVDARPAGVGAGASPAALAIPEELSAGQTVALGIAAIAAGALIAEAIL